MSSEPHFFIVGAGRSGTTLVRNLLSAHSRLAVTPETHFMKRAEKEGLFQGEAQDFEAMWQRLTDWVRFKDLGIDPAVCRARIEETNDHSFRTIFDTMLRLYGELTGKPRVGEKTPSHTRYLSQLFEWFPDARAIALQRDPRAVVASQLKTPWGKKQITQRSFRQGFFSATRINIVTHYAENWSAFYGKILPRWSHDSRVGIVRYEDLVADPESQSRQICDLLGEAFEAGMLADRSALDTPGAKGTMQDPVHDAWRKKHNQQSSRPVSTSSLERWREELTPLEIGVIEARCREPMLRAGYNLRSRPAARQIFNAAATLHNGLGRAEMALKQLTL